MSAILVERLAMKELFALAAVALMLAGCAAQTPVSGQGTNPGSSRVEKNADQDLQNKEIRQPDHSNDLDNDWGRDRVPDRGNDGHENQGSLWPWPGSGLSGGPTYPGGHSWGY